jgi:hypothetical protein
MQRGLSALTGNEKILEVPEMEESEQEYWIHRWAELSICNTVEKIVSLGFEVTHPTAYV